MAATCLHMAAESGQLQLNVISLGEGNRPEPGRVIRSITDVDNRPCSSSIHESMDCAQSLAMLCQCEVGTWEIFTVIRYRLDPMTRAATTPSVICKSITEPFRR